MINYWWVTRPKRRLNSVPESLSTLTSVALDKIWQGDVDLHLSFESSLEKDGVKKVGERRDQTGGGARTYVAWLKSLGLIFKQDRNSRIFTTLAGEAILSGDNPVSVLKNQVLKYQFPSSFSISRSVDVNRRFKIHPFIFLLKLMRDSRVRHLTQEEIAKVVIVEAENETTTCYNTVVEKIINFRNDGDDSLPKDFDSKYGPSKGGRYNDRFGHLLDVANTIINWMEFTRLIVRESGTAGQSGLMFIPDDKKEEVDSILQNPPKFIDRPEEEEVFQRRYGLDPKHIRDNRDLTNSPAVTARMVEESRIKSLFIRESLKKPIFSINSDLISSIVEASGCEYRLVEDTLYKMCPNNTVSMVDAFLSNYRDMAFSGRDEAVDFEKATVEIMREVFGYNAEHVGPRGLTPDVLVISDREGYLGIFDNKAYARYSITNDHHNRMITNYISNVSSYNDGSEYPLSFFSYIAGGFKSTINSQLDGIYNVSRVKGSAISVDNMIQLIKKQTEEPKDHKELRNLFSLGREVRLSDL